MKIGEATQMYSERLNTLWEQKRALSRQQEKLSKTPGREEELGMVTVELASIDEQYDAAHEFMEKLSEMKTALHNEAVAKQQGEAWAEAAADMSKCIETARRIASGGKVPPGDAERLMKFSMEMYMQAMNAAALNKHKENKEYDSLWEDEEAREEVTDVDAEIADKECPLEIPEDAGAEA